MNAKRIKVAVTRQLPEPVETRLKELFDVKLSCSHMPMSTKQILDIVKDFDVLVPTIGDRIDSHVIQNSGKRLSLIANYGAGFDHIDVRFANSKNITVTNTPNVLTEDTADMAMALILSVPRRIKEGVKKLQDDDWDGWAPNALLGHRIYGKKLGILGMGRIGQAIARRANAFGIQVHYHNRNRLPTKIEQNLEATFWESLDQMLTRIDFLSINAPHTPATFHLMNARRLKLMKNTSYIINTARGELIDENALTRMLRSGQLAGAALDVFEKGNKINPRLRELENVFLLPHMSSATVEGRIEMGEKVIVNIKTFVDGHTPPDLVLIN
ncbi:MAG: D-glycerate dehydrogenase [Rhodobacteraceae bacterium]|mgnify:FL=1|nr:MAG: D-glycerate dehydrogenase [Paracoccaceae bacterium]